MRIRQTVAIISTNRELAGGNNEVIGVDAQLVGDRSACGAGLTAQEVSNLLALQASCFAERFERTEPLAQLRFDVLAMNGDHVHAA